MLVAACSPADDNTSHPVEKAAAPAMEQSTPAPSPHGDTMPANPHATGMPASSPHEGVKAASPHSTINVAGASKKGTILVPESVRGHWQGATFIIVDRTNSKVEEVTIKLDDTYVFAGGKVKLTLDEFLPDLRIQDNNVYTSMSNDPNNQAAMVTITENGSELFDGWLFSDFPEVHKFEHDRFGVTLKTGNPA